MGGNAFSNVKPIKKEHINETVESVVSLCLLPSNYRVLGSAGKKPLSGDLDIAVDITDADKQQELFKFLKTLINDHDVRKFSGNISFPWTVPQTREKVQVDFIFGDPEWLSFYYHSPSAEESRFKGTHRNIAMSALASLTERQELSTDVNPDGNCVDAVRWKWSAKTGLSKVHRTYKKRSDGNGYVKTPTEHTLAGPFYTPLTIASILLDFSLSDKYVTNAEKINCFNSLESILQAVKDLYSEDAQFTESLYQRMAKYLSEHHDLKKYNWDYPDEINRYIK